MHPIVISTGDPAGIGPEVTLKAINALHDHPPIIITIHNETLNDPYYKSYINNFQPFNPSKLSKNCVYYSLIDHDASIIKKSHQKDNAIIAHQCIMDALNIIKENNYQNLVTAPISKEGLLNANIPFTGHTSLLQSVFNINDASMAFYSETLNIILATIHIPLSEVEKNLSEEVLNITIKNAHIFAQNIGINQPKIAIAGLNPHAGENGQFGSFENDILIPLINRHSSNSYTLAGPISPDIVFKQALDGEADIVIALYHDQGLIPVKLLSFDSAVNVTIGLPICRTSPDHGTAFDIAFQNKANHQSMLSAINYCIQFNQ